MLKFIKFILIIVTVFLLSCKREPDIQFCEGLTVDGKGKDCGTVFTTGDLTAIIKKNSGFGSNSITVNVYQRRNNLKQRIESIDVEVRSADTKTNTNLSFYNAGVYQIEAIANDIVFAESRITIQD